MKVPLAGRLNMQLEIGFYEHSGMPPVSRRRPHKTAAWKPVHDPMDDAMGDRNHCSPVPVCSCQLLRDVFFVRIQAIVSNSVSLRLRCSCHSRQVSAMITKSNNVSRATPMEGWITKSTI